MKITFDFEHIHLDRSGWPSGEWDREPDHAEWRDQETGLPCMAHRNGSGAWCGYVGVPPGHPWHKVGHGTCVERCGEDWCSSHSPEGIIEVHGGLTYADACMEGRPAGEAICHTPLPGEPDKVWWFGFDTAHLGDLTPAYDRPNGRDTYKRLGYVVGECMSLAAQLAEVAR